MEVVFSWRARFALGFFDEILVETGLACFARLLSRLVLVFADGTDHHTDALRTSGAGRACDPGIKD